jgi:hypothetical protein
VNTVMIGLSIVAEGAHMEHHSNQTPKRRLAETQLTRKLWTAILVKLVRRFPKL